MGRTSKVLEDFGQWKVTTYGIECEQPIVYSISWKQLRAGGPGPGWTWRKHVAEKSWADLTSFDRAHAAAMKRPEAKKET